MRKHNSRALHSGYRGVVSHVATAANEITAKPISVEGGAMRYSDRLAHIPPADCGRLPATQTARTSRFGVNATISP